MRATSSGAPWSQISTATLSRPKAAHESLEFALGGARTAVHQRARHGPLATAAQHEPLARARRDLFEAEARRALLAAAQVGLAEHRRERAVALGRTREHDEVRAGGVVDPDAVVVGVDRDLGPEDRGQTEGPGRLGEAHDAVEPVVVGERQSREAEARAFGGELFGVARPVEEAEARVRVELAVDRISRRSPRATTGSTRR